MKKYILITAISIVSSAAMAQLPEDVLKYSWQPVNGTARINAVGGAVGSLGGDISSMFVNPAGIGLYKTGDIVLSPGFFSLNNKSDFRGTNANDKKSAFNFGPTGFVYGWGNPGKWNGKALSIAINRTANFNSRLYYKGQNDFSSSGEQYAAEIVGSRVPLDNAPGDNTLSFGSRMAAWNYLVDTAILPGQSIPQVMSLAMLDNLKNGGPFLVNQTQTTVTRGGITDISLAYASTMNDKFYIGGSVSVPIVNYRKESTFREEDATGNDDNDFSFSELRENFRTKGAGINAKLGIIVKPKEFIRLGLAIHTPTYYSLEDTYEGEMSVNLDKYRQSVTGTTTISSNELNGGSPAVYRYALISPWRFIVSGSYVIREIEDVRKQKGFITADLEYVTYKSNRFKTEEEFDNSSYYDGLNSVIKDYYKNAFNFRIGGELKFTTIMTRLGFAYYGNPYADKALKADKLFVSGGLGYRNAGFFIDLTYVQALQKDVNFPYRLPDKANTFAVTKGSGSNVSLTVGIKI